MLFFKECSFFPIFLVTGRCFLVRLPTLLFLKYLHCCLFSLFKGNLKVTEEDHLLDGQNVGFSKEILATLRGN